MARLKKSSVFFTLTVLVLTVGCFQDSWVSFSNKTLGYSIKYPSNWERKIIYEEVDQVILTTKKDQGYYGFIAIRSGFEFDGTEDSLDEILNLPANSETQTSQFNGYNAIKSQSEFAVTNIIEPNQEFITEHPTDVVLINNDNQIVRIESILLFGSQQHERELKNILETFEFISEE